MEDYKKKYEEALSWARSAINAGANGMLKEDLEHIFPELKESEDERIWTINYLNNRKLNSSIIEEKESLKKAIAWLEKQGEQKPNDISPIFRVGDYIRNKKTGDKVLIEQLDIATKAYCYVSYDGAAVNHSDFPFSKQDEKKLLTNIENQMALTTCIHFENN